MKGPGLGAWQEEGQGHGGFLRLSRKTHPETKITWTCEEERVGGSLRVGCKERGVRPEADTGIQGLCCCGRLVVLGLVTWASESSLGRPIMLGPEQVWGWAYSGAKILGHVRKL